MSQKKAQQHVVPKVYLNAFRDMARPDGHPPNAPYTGAVWLVPRSLTEPARWRAPDKAFRVLNAYTLKGDDPRRPHIEEWLSRVEAAYARVWRRTAVRAPLTAEDGGVLALFVATLSLRTPEQMAHWQRQMDDVQHLYRQADRAANGHEWHSDAYWAGADEGGKRLVGEAARGVAEALMGGGRFRLVVRGPPPAAVTAGSAAHPDHTGAFTDEFITSDAPVARHEVHVDELLAMGVPSAWLDPDALPNRREALHHCALAPDVALLACPLLRPTFVPVWSALAGPASSGPEAPGPVPYWPVPGPEFVAHLNTVARYHAHRLLVASRPDPFGALKPLLLAADAAARREAVDPRPIVSVYTDSTRVRLRAEALEYGRGAHVLNGRLTFRTRDADALRILAEAAGFPEVTYAAPGRGESGGMLDARVLAVALGPDGETVLENGPSLA